MVSSTELNVDINASPENQLEGIKLQFDAFLAEYKMVRDEVAQYRNMQSQLDSLALTALGLTAPVTLAILDKMHDAFGIIFLIPFLFLMIAFIQIRHERQTTLDAIYVHKYLRPKLNMLLSRLSIIGPSVFGFENFLSSNHITNNLYVQWIITISRASVSLAVSAGLSVAFIYLQVFILHLKWYGYETFLVLLATILWVSNLILGLYVAQVTAKLRFKPNISK